MQRGALLRAVAAAAHLPARHLAEVPRVRVDVLFDGDERRIGRQVPRRLETLQRTSTVNTSTTTTRTGKEEEKRKEWLELH